MKKILIIDDDQATLEVVAILLEEEGYQTVQASSAEGITALLKKENPDLLIVDLLLPGKKGDTLCDELKASPETRHIPLILFSAHNDLRRVMKTCQADDSLAKPFDMQNLLEKVSQLV